MAEYIDRNRLKSELLILKDKIEPNTQWQDGYISAMDVAKMVVGSQPTADVIERAKIDKAIEEIEKIDLIVHDGINHYYKDGEEAIAEVLEILKRNIGE
jgi:hypothetical protein